MKRLKRSAGTTIASALALCMIGADSAHAQKVCDAKAYGAKGDGVTKDTDALQRAIDDCAARGGGTVKVGGAAVFFTGPLLLKSHIKLEIASGTILAGSEEHADYPEMEIFRKHGRQSLLLARDAEDITITGGASSTGAGSPGGKTAARPTFDRS